MFNTPYGVFNGKSWEGLCQQIFKTKYAQDGYQSIPASPGDFGLEGFCTKTAQGFQCYCPEKLYTQKELYEFQRDKITADLKKLKAYEKDLQEILGDTQIEVWRFVTPHIAHNALLRHARKKEKEVRSWGLPFISPNFRIELQDADFYSLEITAIRSAAGESLYFDTTPAILTKLSETKEVYEENVLKKCNARLQAKAGLPNHAKLLRRLHEVTLESFLEADGFFRTIEKTAPTLYFRLVRLINEFEIHVVTTGATWAGTPEDLTSSVRQQLEGRLARQLAPEVDETTASKIARLMVARWLAVCSLDYD